jgi:cell division septum initiation protein DivIVA
MSKIQGEITFFRKRFIGGFNRDDVIAYIRKMAQEKDELTEQIEELRKKNEELQPSQPPLQPPPPTEKEEAPNLAPRIKIKVRRK